MCLESTLGEGLCGSSSSVRATGGKLPSFRAPACFRRLRHIKPATAPSRMMIIGTTASAAPPPPPESSDSEPKVGVPSSRFVEMVLAGTIVSPAGAGTKLLFAASSRGVLASGALVGAGGAAPDVGAPDRGVESASKVGSFEVNGAGPATEAGVDALEFCTANGVVVVIVVVVIVAIVAMVVAIVAVRLVAILFAIIRVVGDDVDVGTGGVVTVLAVSAARAVVTVEVEKDGHVPHIAGHFVAATLLPSKHSSGWYTRPHI